MMAQTVSVHNGNSATVGQEHNDRDPEYLKYHVNQEHVVPDGYHKSIVNEPIEEAINRIFADALEEYNAKKRADTKHPGREIHDYYEHLTNQLNENKKRKAVKGNKSGFEAMQPCYEVIVQIGNCETVNSRVNDTYDPNKLDPVLAEEMLLEAIERTKKQFMIPAVDKEGNPILDENGNQKTWCCIEIIGLYIHDDEIQKGIHAHIDYVPVAHNYKRGLSMQPGLTGALTEMGLVADKIEEVAEERTRLMMEKYGIEYHDSDYVDEKGKQLPKSKLTKEQKLHRRMASDLVPCRTPQMKLQDMFRENIKAVMMEREVPIADLAKENRPHLDKHDFIETKTIMEANQIARGERDRIRDEKEMLSGEIESMRVEQSELADQVAAKEKEADSYDEKIEQSKADLEAIEEKKEQMLSWAKKPKSEKELMDRIRNEVSDYVPVFGEVGVTVPKNLWDHIKNFLKNYFRLEQENKKLKASTSFAKVKEAEKVLSHKGKIIADAKEEAEEIVKAGKNQAASVIAHKSYLEKNIDLKERLEIYESVLRRNPEFAKAVEQERRRSRLFHTTSKKKEVAL